MDGKRGVADRSGSVNGRKFRALWRTWGAVLSGSVSRRLHRFRSGKFPNGPMGPESKPQPGGLRWRFLSLPLAADAGAQTRRRKR